MEAARLAVIMALVMTISSAQASIFTWETSNSSPDGGFSETSVLSSDDWNVSGIVVKCRGEYPARNWTGQTCALLPQKQFSLLLKLPGCELDSHAS